VSLQPEPLVSVFTPVYNGASYLAECIESVLSQTYTNFEYVLTDNSSSDDSLAIARTYEERDRRVRLVAYDEHLSNHLAHWNRSLRVLAREAAYVKVVHADDWLFAQCLELMVRLAEGNTSVGLVGAYRLDEDRVNLDGLPPAAAVLSGREVARSFLLGGPLPFLFGSPTSLLVRADLVRKRRDFYNEGNIHADNEACLDVLSESDFGFVHQVLTYTRRHNEAVTSLTRRLGTFVPADLDMFQRWGPVFLSEDEYDRKLVVRLVEYAAFLSASPMRLARSESRDYHRARLRESLDRTSHRQLAYGLRLQVRHSLGKLVARLNVRAAGKASPGRSRPP
jgi:glycosyltransferase involved in cell wall biosynthesis